MFCWSLHIACGGGDQVRERTNGRACASIWTCVPTPLQSAPQQFCDRALINRSQTCGRQWLPILASHCDISAECAALLLFLLLILQLPLLGVDGQSIVFFRDLQQPLARIPIRKRFRFGAGFLRSISPVARILQRRCHGHGISRSDLSERQFRNAGDAPSQCEKSRRPLTTALTRNLVLGRRNMSCRSLSGTA